MRQEETIYDKAIVTLTQQVLPSFSEAAGEEVREHPLYGPEHQDVTDWRQWDEKDNHHRYEGDRILERSSVKKNKEQ